MIDEKYKFSALNGDMLVEGPTTWEVTDWDQRRTISVVIDGEVEDHNVAIDYLRRHFSKIRPKAVELHFTDTGKLISTNAGPKSDPTCCVHYPSLQDVALPAGTLTVRRNELEEKDRLGPNVDLVTYSSTIGTGTSNAVKKVVFKYYFLWQFAARSWLETNLWMHLPRHPNIVPFDKVVVDEIEGRIVGFTNHFIPGGTLEENKSRVFRLAWLQQLMDLVDDLNLRYGIAHQDIAPRNLLVDKRTDSIMLFDFNFAARVNRFVPTEREVYQECRNDVKGVAFTLYEIITRDDIHRRIPHESQSLDNLPTEWEKHPDVQLDHPVSEFRQTLQAWQLDRAAKPAVEPSEPITWSPRPAPLEKSTFTRGLDGRLSKFTYGETFELRSDRLSRGAPVLNWERPPQSVLDEGIRVLATGHVAQN